MCCEGLSIHQLCPHSGHFYTLLIQVLDNISENSYKTIKN